jgi:dolichol kinase
MAVLKSRTDEHLSRKLFHVGSGTVIAYLFASVMGRMVAVQWILVATAGLVMLDLVRLSLPRLNQLALHLYGPLMRQGEERGPSAQLYYLLGLSFAIVFLPTPIAVQAILILAWMDPVAAVFGTRFGKRRWTYLFEKLFLDVKIPNRTFGSKSVEGSAAGFFAAFLAGIIAWTGPWASMPMGGKLWWPEPGIVLLFSTVGALVSVVAEAWPSQWDDNINVPFWTGLSLLALAQILSVPMRFYGP